MLWEHKAQHCVDMVSTSNSTHLSNLNKLFPLSMLLLTLTEVIQVFLSYQ